MKNASYSSETTANDMLQSLASVIRSDIDTQLQNSPYVSVFADESTDIGCQKKLVIFARMLDPETYIPSTCYLENIKVPDGTGKVVSTAILDCLSDRNVSMSTGLPLGGRTPYITSKNRLCTPKLHIKDVPRTSENSLGRPKVDIETSCLQKKNAHIYQIK